MAKLVVKTEGLGSELIDLMLGATRIGRSPDADFQISHPTVSSFHCELVLRESGVTVRDLESTNGTFVNDRRISEAELHEGETLRLGDVELLVESTEVTVAIPKFVIADLPAPPVVRSDGALVCPRHAQTPATYQCTACREVMCDLCVHQLRRKGSKKVLLLCPVCSGMVEPLGGWQVQKKKSVFARVAETVKMKFKNTVNIGK